MKIDFTEEKGGLRVTGTKTDEVGKLAHGAGLTVLELATHTASLEEAFLQVTAGTEEYQTKKEGK